MKYRVLIEFESSPRKYWEQKYSVLKPNAVKRTSLYDIYDVLEPEMDYFYYG